MMGQPGMGGSMMMGQPGMGGSMMMGQPGMGGQMMMGQPGMGGPMGGQMGGPMGGPMGKNYSFLSLPQAVTTIDSRISLVTRCSSTISTFSTSKVTPSRSS